MTKRKIGFVDLTSSSDEEYTTKKRKIVVDENTTIKIITKEKIINEEERWYLTTITEEGSYIGYEINTEHDLFKPLVNAFLTKPPMKLTGDQYPECEIALYTLITCYVDNEGPLSDVVKSKMTNEEISEISKFLDLELEDLDFDFFLECPKLNCFDYDVRKAIITGRTIPMHSWC